MQEVSLTINDKMTALCSENIETLVTWINLFYFNKFHIETQNCQTIKTVTTIIEIMKLNCTWLWKKFQRYRLNISMQRWIITHYQKWLSEEESNFVKLLTRVSKSSSLALWFEWKIWSNTALYLGFLPFSQLREWHLNADKF